MYLIISRSYPKNHVLISFKEVTTIKMKLSVEKLIKSLLNIHKENNT